MMSWHLDVLQHALVLERVAATPYTFATIFVPVIFGFYLMAVLVQLPGTRFHRAALLPVVLWLAFRASMSLDLSCNHSEYAFLNQGLALDMFIVAMRCTVWTIAQSPYTRLPICKVGNDTIDGHNGHPRVSHDVSISSAMWNACDLTANLRGLGWDGPLKIRTPAPYFRVQSRFIFFLLSLCRVIFLAIILDILHRIIYSFAPDTFGAPKVSTIFDASLPSAERYTKSSLVTLLSGFATYVIIEALYQLQSALFTLLFQQYPSQWPPLFDAPWLSTSLGSFWGRRWHQLFRECFVVVGSKPVEKYFGQAGIVIGAFALSGALHEFGTPRTMDRGPRTLYIVGFFLLQGVGIAMESVWKQITGRRVGGVLGWLWTFFWLILCGHFFVDAWGRTGFFGRECCPEAYRPTTLLLNWMF